MATHDGPEEWFGVEARAARATPTILVRQIQQYQLELYERLKIADAKVAEFEKEKAESKKMWAGGRRDVAYLI